MPDIQYTKTVELPRPMTGLEIFEAMKKYAEKDFRTGRTTIDDDKKLLSFGTQPDSYPYGVKVMADKNGTLLVETDTYQQIIVQNNEGWSGIVFAVRVYEDTVIKYCQKIIKGFLESLG